ncbi:hypothetical protein FB645_003315 [Coemansia sp. IMI 203386]|nr:hypothetical protein FB645_003315 [Coemansia sp. IMI 203386]
MQYVYYTSSTDRSDSENKRHKAAILERILMRGYSPYLTKFSQLLPADEQGMLRSYSDSLGHSSVNGRYLLRQYQVLKKRGLNVYLTNAAMQRLMSQVSADVDASGGDVEDRVSNIVLSLISDYDAIGYRPGASEYTSLVRALSQEVGREDEALQLLDDIVNSSEIETFLSLYRKRAGRSSLIHDRVLTDADIERIEKSLLTAEKNHQAQRSGEHIDEEVSKDRDTDESAASIAATAARLQDGSDFSRIRQLVLERRRQRQQETETDSRNSSFMVSRHLYHAAMSGFAQIYHVRGVMQVLSRMLETAACVPFRLAKFLMPNKDTWDIVVKVLVRQRDRPTFVKTWVDFISKGARPPLLFSRMLVQMLVRQSCLEQAIWVMRISRSLPDVGSQLPVLPRAKDHVPWDLRVQIMYVASALVAATSFDTIAMTRKDALRQGKAAAQLPLIAPPDLDMHTQLIGGAVRDKNDRLAEHFFRELVDSGIAPDGTTYGHLAAMYADKDQIGRVFIIVRGVLVRRYQLLAAESVDRDLGTMSPTAKKSLKNRALRHVQKLQSDVECIVPLLQLYVQANRESEALLLLKSWNRIYRDYVPADKLALALLRVYNQPGDSRVVGGLLHKVIHKLRGTSSDQNTEREQPEPGTNSQDSKTDGAHAMAVYAETIKTHLRAHNLLGVVDVLREMEAHEHHPSYYVWELAMRGFLREQALDLFDVTHAYLRDRLGKPLSLPLYAMWMRTLRNHGDVAGIQAAFDELLELGQIPTQQHYLYLVQTYAYNGWIERAVSIVDDLRKPHSILRPGLNLNIAVVEAHVACNNMERAEGELHYLLDTTPLPKSGIPARPFNYLIIGHLYSGNGRKAMSAYEDMIRLGVKPDVYTFAILMQSYALAKDLDNCMRVFNEMIRIGVAPDLVVYTILICAFGAVRKVGSAELVFSQVAEEQSVLREQNQQQPLDDVLSLDTDEDLEIYTKDPSLDDWSGLLDAASDVKGDAMAERMRSQSFFNLDPVIYIAMLKVYCRAQKPMRALATWDRLLKNFPVVQWDPRKGGILSKTLSFTAQFHLPAWTLLLQTARHSIGVSRVLAEPSAMTNYFFMPLYPAHVASVVSRRKGIKDFIQSRVAAESSCSDAMDARAQLVRAVELELDKRVAADHVFCAGERHSRPMPRLDPDESFADFSYWKNFGLPVNADEDAHLLMPDTKKSKLGHERNWELFDSEGNFVSESAQGIASILAHRWRSLEVAGFKFNNVHVAIYIPCMLLGRQYTELSRFLSLVGPKPKLERSDQPISDSSVYRYYNINIPPYVTVMMARQMKVVQQLLFVDRDRRLLLDALLKRDAKLYQSYRAKTKLPLKNNRRSEDEVQVMKERRAVHLEREIAWDTELAAMRDVALVWLRHVNNDYERSLIDRAVKAANNALN